MALDDAYDIPTPTTDGFYSAFLEPAREAVAPVARAMDADSGGWWDSVLNAVKGIKDFTVGGSEPKDYGVLGTLGKFSQAALPFVGLGTSIFNTLQSREVAQQIANSAKVGEQAQRTQIRASEQGQELAPKAAALAPKIEALAPRFADLSRQAETRVAGPQLNYGRQLLAMAEGGTLDPADEAQIAEYKTKRLADMRDYLARSGQGDSSSLEDLEARVEQEVKAMRADILKGYRQTALQYLQGGGAGLAEAGTLTQAEGGDLALATQPYSAAGGILAGSAGAAGAAASGAAATEQSLEQLIAQIQAQLARMAGESGRA